jgi:hypothetical protein
VRLGVEEVRDAFMRTKITQEEFLGPRYLRIGQIKLLQKQGRLDDNMRWVVNESSQQAVNASGAVYV